MGQRVKVDKRSYIMAHAQEALAFIDETEGLMEELSIIDRQIDETIKTHCDPDMDEDEFEIWEQENPECKLLLDREREIYEQMKEIAQRYALFRNSDLTIDDAWDWQVDLLMLTSQY